MKKLVLIIAFTIASVGSVKAQTVDYYTGKTSVKGVDYEYNVVFKIEYNKARVYLKNINNTKFDVPQYWNGEKVPPEVAYAATFIDSKQGEKAFRQVFSQDEIAAMKVVKGLYIAMGYVISTDGNVIEVEFHFPDNSVLKSINPDKFHMLEQKLKEMVKFHISKTHKMLEYIKGRSNTIEIDKL